MPSYVLNQENSDNTNYNPGNLRWKYTLESIIEREKKNENSLLVNQLMSCLASLSKFPLVLEEVTHCAILDGFNADIISMMKNMVTSNESNEESNWRPIKNLENWNFSPISKKATENISDNELDSKHTFSASNKRSDRHLIVDLTNEEEQINSNDNSEDSDYKMALMLSQEELKSVNEEAKNRKDREKLDFQMALRLSQVDDLENEIEPQKLDLNLSGSKNNEKENPNLDLPNIDINGHNNGLVYKKADDSIKTRPLSPINPFLPPSPNTDDHILSEFENESMLFRDHNEVSYSFTDTVEITPPVKLISTPLSKNKRKKEYLHEDRNKILKNKYTEDHESERLSSLRVHGVSDNLMLDDSQPCSSQKNLFNDNTAFQDQSISNSAIESRGEYTSEETDSSSITKKMTSKSKAKSSEKSGKHKKSQSDTTSDSNVKLVGKKQYIPKPGSGGYAILIALFYNESSPNYKGYLTKDELIDAAQPFANQSMRYSNPGVKFTYCGYSASTILAKKELITKTKSKTVQISLTESGRKMAENLINVRETAEIQASSSELVDNSYGRSSIPNICSKTDLSSSETTQPDINTDDSMESKSCNSRTLLPKNTSMQSKLRTTEGNITSFDDPSWLEGLLNDEIEISTSTSKYSATKTSLYTRNKELRYCYITDKGQESNDQNDAEVDIDNGVSYLVGCLLDDLKESGKSFRMKEYRQSMKTGQLVFVYIGEDDCDETSPVASVKELDQTISESIIKSPNKISKVMPMSNDKVPQTKRSVSKAHKDAAQAAILRNIESNKEISDRISSDSDFCISLQDMNIDLTMPEHIENNDTCTNNTDTSVILKPGDYEIILIVDDMEVKGGSSGGKQSRKSLTLEQLDALNINFETRKLSIGDFIWIARSRNFKKILEDEFASHQAGGKKLTAKKTRELKENAMARELVLPYIVERKRTDDLKASIMDGRYKEQKQRLSQCGLKNKYYLVEEVGGKFADTNKYAKGNNNGTANFHRGIDRDVLEQAITNTSVRDGFFIKRTKTQGESVKFIAAFTTALSQNYTSNVTLKSSSVATTPSYSNLTTYTTYIDRAEEHVPNFLEFNDFSRPDKPISVRETFCNMLMSIKGLSPGMAWAITEKFPTPLMLKNAYKDIASDNSKDKEKAIERVLAGIPYDHPVPKKIPPSMAKTVGFLFSELSLT